MEPVTLFKCLADDIRVRCMLLLQQQGELCVCELSCALAEIQPKISRHLALLKKANLLLDRRQGIWIFYRIHPELPDWVVQILQTAASHNQPFLAENLHNLSCMGDRPERLQSCCTSANTETNTDKESPYDN